MNKKIISLKPDEIKLLQISAAELCVMLEEKPELSHVKQNAYTYWSEKEKAEYQVQVTVTRRQDDFLEDFQTEEMNDRQFKI